MHLGIILFMIILYFLYDILNIGDKMISIWTKDYIDYKLPIVNKDIETPILIIGGGISGLMCAYFLMKENRILF